MDYYKEMSVGERLATARKAMKLTQSELGEKLFVTQKLVHAWENGKRDIKAQYVDGICSALNITSSQLLRGVSEGNETLSTDLGLSNESLEFLKHVNKNKDVFFTDASVYDADFVGMVEGEGASNRLILKTLNLILSTNCGQDLLQAIGNYCFADFNKGFPVYDAETPMNKVAPVDDYGKEISADSIRFNVEGCAEGCSISLNLMKFALLQAIENSVNNLRMNVKGDE